ncbi:TlyA family RNA methyltransferase [Humibacter ginsenosidimutans]|uniref:TlyA family RNA methyltransferase n=1 Tax=Humibacter ginsenosidimutans TaxID=2599293 RepID=A0A5B8LZI6_9MICO|nr:TlyA family RNA methyltransferase [Humibacter ginsenosidimutans]QDZ13553.1 TlyA family RNA methyltransferase [Humibacter ginsenosidimutans]
MSESRLDAAVTARGLARSRTHAARLIAEGRVSVDGRPAVKASTKVADESAITVAEADHYVSRAAHKLIAALDGFGIDPAGVTALDVGASTGGFTQVLLERGARHVVALDVGHGQLNPTIATDQRVTVAEGVNVRYLDAAELGVLTGERAVDLVVGDLSFISLTLVLPPLVGAVGRDAEFVVLVKPQFEVGRTGIKEGIVRNSALREDAVTSVMWAAWDLGLPTAGILASPIVGSHGNREYLLWLSAREGRHPTEWLDEIGAMVGE